MIIVWPKFKRSRTPWRDTIHSYLTVHMSPDVSRLCIEYMLPPAEKSCADSCGTVDILLGQAMPGHYHLRTCPIAPEMCYSCAKCIHVRNYKCKNRVYHWAELCLLWLDYRESDRQCERNWRYRCDVNRAVMDWLRPRLFGFVTFSLIILAWRRIINPITLVICLHFVAAGVAWVTSY